MLETGKRKMVRVKSVGPLVGRYVITGNCGLFLLLESAYQELDLIERASERASEQRVSEFPYKL